MRFQSLGVSAFLPAGVVAERGGQGNLVTFCSNLSGQLIFVVAICRGSIFFVSILLSESGCRILFQFC